MRSLARLLGRRKQTGRQPRRRLKLDLGGAVTYAVGDVHGRLDALQGLERNIVRDAARLPAGERRLIIMLGDYVDRGPASAQALEHLLAPAPDGFERICLAGNHEMFMLDYLEGRLGLADWIRMGGAPTLHSYGIDPQRLNAIGFGGRIDEVIASAVPASHVAFLRSLPVLVETPKFLFVHAGVRPGVEPARQSDEDLLFIRSAFYDNAHLLDRCVVHGHNPVSEPKLEGLRLNIDTGAYFSGRLTAVRVWRNKGRFLTN